MKIFISWSGDRSRPIADSFRKGLPLLNDSIELYFSPADTAKGTRWTSEVAAQLDECSFGLLIVTPENLMAPWILFEAGALSKRVDAARVCPLLFGLKATDLEGPLTQFQATTFTQSEVRSLAMAIHSQLPSAQQDGDRFTSRFDLLWPSLESDVAKAMSQAAQAKTAPIRSDRDLLEEILTIMRDSTGSGKMDDALLCRAFEHLVDTVQSRKCSDESILRNVYRLGQIMMQRASRGNRKGFAQAMQILGGLLPHQTLNLADADDSFW